MKLDLHCNGTSSPIEFAVDGNRVHWTYQGVEREAEFYQPEPGIYTVLMDGRSIPVVLSPNRSGGGYEAVIGGRTLHLELSDPRRATSGVAVGSQGGKVAALMPGKVVRLLVAPGDLVTLGQGVIVVEAMKMQNEMKAPRDGVVAAVHVEEGATVAAGQVLILIE